MNAGSRLSYGEPLMQEVVIPLGNVHLEGEINIPLEASGLVIFAHGSGSSRHSSRNQFVARSLREHGLGTFLFDLLSSQEEAEEQRTRHLRFNIPFLAQRLTEAARFAENLAPPDTPIGFFGASTGAAAALVSATKLKDRISAIVSRGGRPDLAGDSLQFVRAPTLLIVGGRDYGVIELNQQAFEQLNCKKHMEVVAGATHLFEEPGTLEEVASLAGHWFKRYLKESHESNLQKSV